jgi:hypothetical protein
MKKFAAVLLVLALALSVVGCGPYDETTTVSQKETAIVNSQQSIYAKAQPVPLFNYSLPRDLWIQFYKASTSNVVRTWSCEVSAYGKPISEIYESVGYPIPMDTQLTNSQMVIEDTFAYEDHSGQVVAQPEPNGLFTSPNTNATIIMVADADGKVTPIYSEHMVQCWAFKVVWDKEQEIFVRAEGAKSTILLETEGVPAK